MAQLLHLFVDGRVFFNERVRAGDIGLGLIVVVVADEVHDGVVGEEFLKLAGKLCGKRFIRGHHQRGFLHRFDGFGHGERLARTGDAEKRLVALALANSLCELFNGLGLVA